MREQVEQLRAFLDEKQGIQPKRMRSEFMQDLWLYGDLIARMGDHLEDALSEHSDPRILRAHLLLEELGETLQAMSRGEEQETLDGLADLLYVAIGAGVQLDLPVAEAFEEVHRSNMTKAPKTGPRLRDKGPNYDPPDLEAVLRAHRESD